MGHHVPHWRKMFSLLRPSSRDNTENQMERYWRTATASGRSPHLTPFYRELFLNTIKRQ